MGPKKPQRSSSTSEPSNYFSSSSNPNLFLETSFTSLQSPSSNSSITNGYYSTRTHPSPSISLHHPISFSLSLKSNRSDISTKSHPSPGFGFHQINTPSISKSFSLNLRHCASPRIDLVQDDWLGLAPLASPESFSELSSMSSRTSLVATSITVEINTPKIMRRTPRIIGNLSTCADDIRNIRNFERAKVFPRLFIMNNNNTESSSSSNLSFESAASSNKCCGECPTRSSLATPNKPSATPMLDVSKEETSATSDSGEFQSAEDILDGVLRSAGCQEFFSSGSSLLEAQLAEGSPPPAYGEAMRTPIYPQLASPCSPGEVDPDIVSNLAIDLSINQEPRSIEFMPVGPSSLTESTTSRTPSDTAKNVTFNPQVVTVDATLCESRYSPPIRWRLFRAKHSKKPDPAQPKPSPLPSAPVKTILCTKRRGLVQEVEPMQPIGFSRAEALPLLSGLTNSAAMGVEHQPSPARVRRKKYVYPSDVVVMESGRAGPSESSV